MPKGDFGTGACLERLGTDLKTTLGVDKTAIIMTR